ncbi:MAG: ferrochelatase [Bauldia sp.]|nr:ferrochelatase [Bauldia sp.]
MNAPAPFAQKTARPADRPAAAKVGVLLINLGTPDATDTRSVRRYLREFLSDKRVIELPRAVWLPILNLFVLTTRPRRSGEAYRAIWDEARDESPLRTITRAQAQKLGESLAPQGVTVDWAMRYGNPSIASRIEAMREAGCERILLAPLYPQYSAATTATANDKAFDALKRARWQPAVRTLPAYYDEEVYIDALARSLTGHLAALDFEPEVVLVSYHGLPKDYVAKGDPYCAHCARTTSLLRERLGWTEKRMPMSFQSRFGKAEWLQPYTDMTVKELGKSGVKRLAVVMPGFSADCIETLEEIAMQNGEFFHESGGEKFAAIPCLNDSREGMDVIEAMVRRELQGWI